jgi:hypothetical protein
VHAQPCFVTTQAGVRLHLDRSGILATEVDVHQRPDLFSFHVLDVRFAGAVTGLAAWSAPVSLYAVRRLVHGQNRDRFLFVMASGADFVRFQRAIGRWRVVPGHRKGGVQQTADEQATACCVQ